MPPVRIKLEAVLQINQRKINRQLPLITWIAAVLFSQLTASI